MKKLIATGVLLLASSGAAFAVVDPEIFTTGIANYSTGSSTTDWVKTLDVAKFDGSLGKLLSVDINWNTEVVTEATIRNDNETEAVIQLSSSQAVNFDFNGTLDGSTAGLVTGFNEYASGETKVFGPQTDAFSDALSITTNLGDWTGNDFLEVIASTIGGYGVIGGGGNMEALVATTALAEFDVVYTYTNIQTPLPAAAWLFGTGLMGLVGVSRRKKSAKLAA